MQIFKKQKDAGRIPPRVQHGPKEAAMLLGMSERKLYQFIDDDRLKTYKVDGKRFVSRVRLTVVVS